MAGLLAHPLQHLALARLAALKRSSAAAGATQAAAEWRARCEAYREHAGPPEDAKKTLCDGLTFWIPRTGNAGGLERSLLSGHLRWDGLYTARLNGGGGTILDIGGNIGTTSIPRIVAGDAQRVYSAEPEPMNYGCFVENVKANGLEGFVFPDAVAISDSIGSARLRVSSMMGNHYLRPDDGADGTLEVPVTTLDAWVARHEIELASVSLVKVDVQGFEPHVIRGASALLAQDHVSWLIEVSPKHLTGAGTPMTDFFALLEQHFAFAMDPGHFRKPVPVRELRRRLAGLGTERKFTDLFLYN